MIKRILFALMLALPVPALASDVATWTTAAGGNTSAAPDGFPEGMAPSTVNNAAREVMAAVARWYEDTNATLTSGGSSNTYTLTTTSTHAALADQSTLVFLANHTNTGAATLNVDSLGAKTIKTPIGNDLSAGDITANHVVVVVYNATSDVYNMVNAFPGESTFTGPLALPDSEITIAAGAATPTRPHHSVDTESDASTDNLDNLNTTDTPDGGILYIYAEDGSPTVTLRHEQGGSGQLHLQGGLALDLDDTNGVIPLIRRGTDWYEVGRPPQGRVYLGSVVASNVTSVSFRDGNSGIVFDSTFDVYEVDFVNITPATDDTHFYARVTVGGTAQTADYDYNNQTYASDSGGAATTNSTSAGQMVTVHTAAGDGVGNAASEGLSGTLKIFGPANGGTKTAKAAWDLQYDQAGGNLARTVGGGAWQPGSLMAVDGLEFLFSSGNVSTGTFHLYGIKK